MERNTSIERIYEFLDYTVKKNFFTEVAAGNRRTACNNLFSVLDDDQKTVEYVVENLESMAHRMNTKYRDKFTGQTTEAYKSRVKKTVEDFLQWADNKSAWERNLITRAKDGGKAKAKKSPGKEREAHEFSPNAGFEQSIPNDNVKGRTLSFPIRADFEVRVGIPFDGLTGSELQRLGLFLLPYCKNFSSQTWREVNWPNLPEEAAAN